MTTSTTDCETFDIGILKSMNEGMDLFLLAVHVVWCETTEAIIGVQCFCISFAVPQFVATKYRSTHTIHTLNERSTASSRTFHRVTKTIFNKTEIYPHSSNKWNADSLLLGHREGRKEYKAELPRARKSIFFSSFFCRKYFPFTLRIRPVVPFVVSLHCWMSICFYCIIEQ